jgi:hypothetical protein
MFFPKRQIHISIKIKTKLPFLELSVRALKVGPTVYKEALDNFTLK